MRSPQAIGHCDMQEWIRAAALALQVSVIAQVFAIGLGTTWQDATYLFKCPRLLGNSILARNVAVPVIAIVLVPVTIELMDWALGARAHFSPGQVAQLMGKAILAPLGAGMLASRYLPKLRHLAPYLLMAGSVLLVAGAIPLLLVAWKTIGTLSGNGAMLALALFIIAGTAAGHLLGGPVAEDRMVLAIATSSRHPGLAFAIAKANFPEQATLVAGAVIIYLIFRLILAVPYLRWRRHAAPGPASPQAAAGRRQFS